MNKKLIITFVLLLASVFTLSACKKTVSEKISEEAIEKATGENADVNVDGNEVTVEIGDGTMKSGEKLDLPADWPEDVYVTEGNIITSSNMNGGHNLTIVSSKTVDEVKEEYDEKLSENGWKETSSLSMGDAVMVGAQKDDRNLSLSITVDEGKTTVMLVVNSF